MTDKWKGSSKNLSEDPASGVTETVIQVATSTADSIQEIVSSVADTAQHAAVGVVDKVQDVTGAVATQAHRVTNAVADQVETLAETVSQTVAAPDAPALQRNVAETTVNVLDRTAEYLREGDVQLVLEDVRRAIRRNPGKSVLLGLAAGYLARSTFFGSASTISSGATRPAQPFMPRYQTVPVSSDDFGMSSPVAYPAPTMSGSTLGLDLPTVVDLDVLTTSGDMTTRNDLFGGHTDTEMNVYGDVAGTDSVFDGLAASSTSGFDVDTIGAVSSPDFGMSIAPTPVEDFEQNDLADETTPNSNDVFASSNTSDDVLANEPRQLGGEVLRSDSSSFDEMPSDDLLPRWEAETRDRTDDA